MFKQKITSKYLKEAAKKLQIEHDLRRRGCAGLPNIATDLDPIDLIRRAAKKIKKLEKTNRQLKKQK